MQVRVNRIIVAVLVLAPAVGHSRGQGGSSLKAQLAAARERHQRAVTQYRQAGAAAAPPVTKARYEEERRRDLGNLLDQAERHPDDSAAVPAIQFVINADYEGSIGVLDRAIGLLSRDHVSRPGNGQYCRFLAPYYYAPAAESFIRAVLAKHPDRWERAGACLALGTMLRIKSTGCDTSASTPT
ncbi:MAG: hypothetical protein P4L84_13665 [Isosphaeraceae bacterium]|nr:hypothetical protein [Isosphaeraceae bacterium]